MMFEYAPKEMNRDTGLVGAWKARGPIDSLQSGDWKARKKPKA